MLNNLLDAAVPTPIDFITYLFTENPLIGLFVLLPVIFSIAIAIVFIALAAKRERDEDKKHEEEYRKRIGQ